LGFTAGTAAVLDGDTMAKVWPSAGARSISMMPIAPPAPPLLSTTTGWPSSRPRPSLMARAITSVEPPAANGTISLTGRLGKAWARTPCDQAAAPDAAAAMKCLRCIMGSSPVAVSLGTRTRAHRRL
jgi:hypothetical protein